MSKMKIIIHDFPLAPSSNALRASFFDRKSARVDKKTRKSVLGRMRHYDTVVYRHYKTACKAWALKNSKQLKEAAALLRKVIKEGQVFIRVDCHFGFTHSELWSKPGRLKVIDASNRIKATHDELAKYLGIDDSHFQVGAAEKCLLRDDEPNRTCIVLTLAGVKLMAQVDLEANGNKIYDADAFMGAEC